ncbi:MAG: DoxX family protein [Nitrospirae bacterium]|nr:DoxX family protein [Nitrospirota bacterium]
MAKFMSFLNNQTYAAMRMVVGFLFLWHGVQKLFSFPPSPEGMPPPPEFVIYIAGPIELIGGALVMIGLFTRYAAFLCSGLMAVAYWMVHGQKALLPIQNGGELAALYCFIFLFIATQGSNMWGLDKK